MNEFMDGFTEIGLALKEMYQVITSGGNASLDLVDSLDPFSEGIGFGLVLDTWILCHCYHPMPNINFEKLDRRRCAFSCPPIQRTVDDHDDSAMEKKAMTWMLIISNRKHPSSPVHRTNSKCMSKKRENSMLIRSLLISAVNLMCNFPAIVLRIFWTVQGTGDTDVPFTYEWMRFAEPISQMLYFAQFTCNAFYLSMAIFEMRVSTKLPRRISSSRSAMSKVVYEEPPSINGAPSQPSNDIASIVLVYSIVMLLHIMIIRNSCVPQMQI